jgi:hypothetical protein
MNSGSAPPPQRKHPGFAPAVSGRLYLSAHPYSEANYCTQYTPTYFVMNHFNIISHISLGVQDFLQTPCMHHPMRVTCPAHFILNMINPISGDKCQLWSSSLCSLLQPCCFLLLSSTHSSQQAALTALSLRYSLSVKEQVSETPIIIFSRKYLLVALEEQQALKPQKVNTLFTQ